MLLIIYLLPFAALGSSEFSDFHLILNRLISVDDPVYDHLQQSLFLLKSVQAFPDTTEAKIAIELLTGLDELVTKGSSQVFIKAFQSALFFRPWDFSVFELETDIIGLLVFTSRFFRNFRTELGLSRICPFDLVNFSNLEISSFLFHLIKSKPHSITNPVSLTDFTACELLQINQGLLLLSQNTKETSIGPFVGVFDTPHLFRISLLINVSYAVEYLLTPGIFETLKFLQSKHFKNKSEYFHGSYADQLVQIETEYRSSMNTSDSSFSPVHSDADHRELVESLYTMQLSLSSNDVPASVMAGTALGAYRYHGINPWEHDAELSVLSTFHLKLIQICLEQTVDPEKSIIYSRGVKFDLHARRGHSHKFYALSHQHKRPVYHAEYPNIPVYYPHGDIVEYHHFPEYAGQQAAWKIQYSNFYPFKRVLIGEKMFWGPANMAGYLEDYFKSMTGIDENVEIVCRGHRGKLKETIQCSDLDAWLPRVQGRFRDDLTGQEIEVMPGYRLIREKTEGDTCEVVWLEKDGEARKQLSYACGSDLLALEDRIELRKLLVR
jgi:hypothetical protein